MLGLAISVALIHSERKWINVDGLVMTFMLKLIMMTIAMCV